MTLRRSAISDLGRRTCNARRNVKGGEARIRWILKGDDVSHESVVYFIRRFDVEPKTGPSRSAS